MYTLQDVFVIITAYKSTFSFSTMFFVCFSLQDLCWSIHNFRSCCWGYHLVLTWSNNLYHTCWWAWYNWWKLLRLYLVYFPFVIIESNRDHHLKLVSLSFTFAFLFSVLQMCSSIVYPLMLWWVVYLFSIFLAGIINSFYQNEL